MMKRNNLLIFLICLWLLFAVSMVLAQDETPTVEAPTVIVTAEAAIVPVEAQAEAPVGSVDNIIFFAMMGAFGAVTLGMAAIIAYLSKLVGNSVKTEQLESFVASFQKWAYEQAVAAAGRTPQAWDDNLVPAAANFLGYHPSLTARSPNVIPAAPTLPPAPYAKPLGTLKYLAPYEMRLDMPQGRQIHVPSNMGYYHKTQDGAGKEYPHPNVNVNGSYGARFDIAHIAGTWGFTLLFTLDKDVKYKVTVDYSATITGDKLTTLSDWLWWELLLGNESAGPNVGISNGARHEASWVVEGNGYAVMVTPCIHAQWASAGDTSVIEWHTLTITPIE